MTAYEMRETEYQAIRQFLKLLRRNQGAYVDKVSLAVSQELTPRQKEMVEMYFIRQMPMTGIAQELGVNVSTVSRTLKRSKLRLRRFLQYGGRALLSAVEEE